MYDEGFYFAPQKHVVILEGRIILLGDPAAYGLRDTFP